MKAAKNRQAVLFIMSGLPASGKSTLAKHIASHYGAVHLRIDTLEQGLKDICRLEVTGEAYRIAYRIAADNLKRGLDVVADCCNPLHMTRKEWEDCAREAGGSFIHIEISCSDEEEHRKRVENRESDITGLELPDWEAVKNRYYEDWEETADRIRIDTAHKDVADSQYELEQEIQNRLYPSAEKRYLRSGSILTTRGLSIGYLRKGRKKKIQSGLNLSLQKGELLCLIGPNGSGKSTLLRSLAGLQEVLEGDVLLEGRPMKELSRSESARMLSVVLTESVEIENACIRDIVRMGRQPHTSWWGALSAADEEKVNESIALVHLEDKADRNISELSDGERQRAMIAKALAQDTPIVLLDEPTAHLDLSNRVEIMLLLHRLAHTTNKAILLSTHELDMALQVADRIWLMSSQASLQEGVPEDLVLNGSFNRVFQSPNYVFNTTNGNFSMNYPLKKEICVRGDKTRMYWTLRALARIGYRAVPQAVLQIEARQDDWLLNGSPIYSMEELLETILHKQAPI